MKEETKIEKEKNRWIRKKYRSIETDEVHKVLFEFLITNIK